MTHAVTRGHIPARAASLFAVWLLTTTSPADAQTSKSGATLKREVRALARLEPESGVVVVGARPGMRVERVLVKEGQSVKPGEMLAVLEGHEAREQQVALAEAQVKAAAFRRALRRDELALEREAFDKTKDTRLDALKKTVDDLRSKVEPEKKKDADGKESSPAPAAGGMVPQVMRDQLAAQLRGELAKSEVQLKELEVSLSLLDRKRKLEDRTSADDSPEAALLDRQVELAKADLAQSEVRAPIAAKVLAVTARAGEVSSGPILSLGDPAVMTARAEVFQSDVLAVAVGDPAAVEILGRSVAGEVTRVGTIVSRNTVTSLDPTALTDRRVVEVVVRLADPAIAARLINMEVEVGIRKAAPEN